MEKKKNFLEIISLLKHQVYIKKVIIIKNKHSKNIDIENNFTYKENTIRNNFFKLRDLELNHNKRDNEFKNNTINSNDEFGLNQDYSNVLNNNNNFNLYKNNNIICYNNYINVINPINQNKNLNLKTKDIDIITSPHEKTNNNISLGKDKEDLNQDKYLIKMFGRIGWICRICNNFNFESRCICNRCKAVKAPKTKEEIEEKKKETNKNKKKKTKESTKLGYALIAII